MYFFHCIGGCSLLGPCNDHDTAQAFAFLVADYQGWIPHPGDSDLEDCEIW